MATAFTCRLHTKNLLKRAVTWLLAGTFCCGMANAQQVVLDVQPLDDQIAEKIRAASETIRLVEDGSATSQDILAAARSDFSRILGALYSAGHYGGRIAISLDDRPVQSLSPFQAPREIGVIRITVAPGNPFRFGTTQISPLATDTVLPEAFSRGSIASSDVVRKATSAAIDAWRAEGFAMARTKHQQIAANHGTSRLDVDIGIDPGRRLSFGTLVISGNERTSDQRIEDIAGLQQGQQFSPQVIENAADRLRATGAFSSVSLREQWPSPTEDTLNAAVQLTEAPLRRLGAGAEIASDEGLSLSAFWLHRNLFGGAERLRFDSQISEIGGTQSGIDYTISAAFRRPGTFAAGTDLVVRTALERGDGVSARSDSFTFYFGAERQISRDLTAEIGLEFLAEDTDRRPGRTTHRILSLPSILGFDTRDDALSPSDGVLAQLELRPFVSMRGDGHGLRAAADFRAYRALGKRLVLAGRLQWGSVFGSQISQTPSDYLFLSGGSGTVRGQPFESLGTSTTGSFTGGRSFLGGSIEARLSITDVLGMVAFYDRAFIGADSLPFANGGYHSGYGLGARYQTAIGALRMDVGFPVGASTRPKLYIGIGQAF